jgi:outer membrane receptor protein involved in Fe transport
MGIETKIAGWDVSAFYSWAQNKSVTTTKGLLNTGNIKKALSGDACTGSCVPLNIFGGQGSDSKYIGDGLWTGSGSITPEMVNYITFLAHDTGENEMKNFGFDVSGELAQLPSGPIGVAFGYEHRKEEGGFEPDAFIAAGLSSGNAASPVKGEFEVDETFLELFVPVAQGLDLSASIRYSDYSSFGETTNSKLGLTYTPNEIVTFRATYAEGFRAPSIGALYSGNNDSYPDLQDPCDVNADNFTGNADGTQSGQCLTDGVPAGFTQPNTQIRVTVGGNPNVQPEESEGYNLGVILAPVEGLKLYADYYEIEITDTISTIGSQLIMNGCYRENNQAYCALIDRLSTGYVKDLRNTTNNIGMVETSGFEIAATYDWSDELGNWRFSSEIAVLDTYDVTKADGSVEHYAGYVTGNGRNQFKELKGNIALVWNKEELTVSLAGQYHGEVDGVAGQVPRTSATGSSLAGDEIRTLGDTWYWDAQASYIFESINSTLTVGVDNILDEDPPYFPDSFANDFDPSYRTWGSQFWYVRVASQF